MNSVFTDPDVKVNMSLDEIIELTRGEKISYTRGKSLKTIKKKQKNQIRRTEEVLSGEHSVPNLSSPGGVDIYMSKQSPVLKTKERLSVENKRRITQAASNRVMNYSLLQKSKEIIPAEYKLVKTVHGVERILVPAVLKPQRKKLLQPRKLNKTRNGSNLDVPNEWLADTPPPLISSPIFHPPPAPENGKMEVEPDVVIMEPPEQKKHFQVIDVESDLPVDLLEARKLCLTTLPSEPQRCGRTLHDRFTMLSKKLEH